MRRLAARSGASSDLAPVRGKAAPIGQEVRLCVPPDFRDWIEGLGFPVTPIGPELRKLTAASPPAMPAPLSPEVGIGTAHAPGTPTADSLTSALERTLQPEVAARARSVAAAGRSDGARAAARRLIEEPFSST